jgi:hypothetical protein
MKKYIFILMLLFNPVHNTWAAIISAQVDRNPVYLEDSFNLFFSADASPDGAPDFSPLEKDFHIIRQNQSSNISIVNGKYTKNIKWNLVIMAKRTGILTIPSIAFGKDSSASLRLSVKAAEPKAANSHADVFMELEIQPDKIWMQGQITVTMRFLSAINLSHFSGFPELKTRGVDAVISTLGEVKQYQSKRGDRHYLVFEQHYAIFPQQSGLIEILPLIAEARLAGQASSRFDPFQNSGQIKRVRSAAREINILPAAANYTGRHWLPANEVQLSDEWPEDAATYKAGEPITRTLTIMADGLSSAQLPEFNTQRMDGVKQYADKPGLQDIKKDTGIIGMRQEKIAYIPARAGAYTVPAIEVSWWNTQTGKQETARLPAKTIHILAADNASTNTATADNTAAEIQPQQIFTAPTQANANTGPWLALSLFLACGWLLTLALWWLREKNKKRPAAVSTDRGLSLSQTMKQLHQACRTNNPSTCKQALLNWGQQRHPEHSVMNLGQLGKRSGEPLQTEINQLERILYSSSSASWNGTNIARICQQLSLDPPAKKVTDDCTLEPLYK